MTAKRRIYQVAREFKISNEALIEFLRSLNFKVRNHMALVTDDMYSEVAKHFGMEEAEVKKESDIRKKIEERQKVEKARREAIQHEIKEILEVVSKTPIDKIGDEYKKIEKEKREDITVEDKIDIKDKEETSVVLEPEIGEVAEEEKISADEKSEGEVEKEKKAKPRRHLKRLPKKKVKKEAEEAEEGRLLRGKIRKKREEKEEAPPLGGVTSEQKKRRKKRKKRKKKKAEIEIDEQEIQASIKETLAKMSEPTRKKKRKKLKKEEEGKVEEENVLQVTEFTSVAELANLMEVEPSEVIQVCMSMGLMVTINQRLDKDVITMVADEFGYDVKFLLEYGDKEIEEFEEEEEDPSLLKPRPPVVTIMGHVDHGKTTLLDYIRKSNIIAGESGGITQHIGAYEVSVKNKKITFLDTPGHEAFTAMRARGAQVTDIVVLVVAADDEVMPQTIEAINHAQAAGVPIIVAINKIDKPNVNIERIKKQLSENNVLIEEWGGKVQCVEISAKTGQGVDHLLEMILLEAEILELKANPDAKAKGVLIEIKMEKGRGIIGTILIQKGTLRIGDPFVAGQFSGRVRAMFDERNNTVNEAPPSTPVQVLGFDGVPQAGDLFMVMESEHVAKQISQKRQILKREQSFRQVRRITLDQISKQIAEGKIKELSIIIKADVDGSLEAICDSLMELATEDVGVRIIHKGVGTITETDVLLAEASNAAIIGFHVNPNAKARELAKKENVDIRIYKVIYDIVEDIKLALSGLLEPEISEEVIGKLEIRDVFKASKVGVIAGCYVQSGKVVRNSFARLIREGDVIYDGKISSLKRFKDDVKEVKSGYECGLTLENFNDIRPGDTLEIYQVVETARTL